jgi:hypothetical protein
MSWARTSTTLLTGLGYHGIRECRVSFDRRPGYGPWPARASRRSPICVVESVRSEFRRISFGKTISCVGHGESAVRLRRHFDPMGRSIVGRWRGHVGSRRRRRDRRHRHCGGRFVEQIGDEHPRHSVFLSAQLGEVHLPKVFQARRTVDHHHRVGFTAFARAVVHNPCHHPQDDDLPEPQAGAVELGLQALIGEQGSLRPLGASDGAGAVGKEFERGERGSWVLQDLCRCGPTSAGQLGIHRCRR